MRVTLRTRIFGFLLIVMSVTFSAYFMLVQPRLLSSFEQLVQRESRQQLITIAENLVPLLIQNQYAGIHENLDELLVRFPTWLYIELVGENGQRLYPLIAEPIPVSPNITRMSHEIRFRDTTHGRLTAYVDLTKDRREAQILARDTLLIVVGVLLVAILLIGVFLEVAVSRRTRKLSVAAERLAARDFEAALPRPGTDEIGDLVCSFASMRDSVRAYEVSLRDALIAAESANRAKSRFLATMSHELRTPLNGILGMAQLLTTPEVSLSQRKDYAGTILSSGRNLLILLNDILDLSRIEAGKISLELAPSSPEQLIRDVRMLFSGAARDKNLLMEHQWLGSPDSRYQFDPNRLRQMLSNLVSNALKFTVNGTIRIEGTELERIGESAMLEFSVSDTGIGIPAEKLDVLFQPFSQADSSITREFGGTGLGLSIVRNFARLMGGDAGVETEAGIGSRFWFRIRAEIVAGLEPRPHADDRADETNASASSHSPIIGTVLVVEDTQINRKVIEFLLIRLGLKVMLAEDGQQAVNAIKRGDGPDAILMDVQMPVMDGYAATKLIRHWERENDLPRLPIIALTANAFADDRQNCLDSGMDDFLTKPVVFEALRLVLEKWLPIAPEFLPGEASKPLEVDRFVALFDKITPLLKQNKYDSIGCFGELQALVAGTEIAAEIDAVGRELKLFHFDKALELLERVAATQTR